MTSWALRVEPCDPVRLVRRLGPLRLRAGLEGALADDGATWVRGAQSPDAALDVLLRATGAERYEVDPSGEVRSPGKRLPAGRLPRGPWRPLPALLALEVQPALAAVDEVARAPLTLVRGAATDDVEPGALVVERAAFVGWALGAPQRRLAPLDVAVRDPEHEVVVRGRPLPPLPGARFRVDDVVAVPCGLVLSPALDAATLRALLGLEPGDLAIFTAAGVERVEARWFAPATRSLARSLEAR